MKLHSRAVSFFLAILIIMISVPMLATSPQGGDGAEMLNAALYGGVLHPPGFPLQGWLNRLFIHLPISNPVTRLSFLSLLAHAGTTFLISEGLRLSGIHVAAQIFGSLAYALFPSTWYSGVQPEVFAISHFCIAAAITQAIRSFHRSAHSWSLTEGAQISILGALSLAQSPITVTAAPAFAFSAFFALRKIKRGRIGLTLFYFLLFLLTLIATYETLPFLRTQSPWPDWGKLSTHSSIFNHFLRKDFGTFSLLPENSLTGEQRFTSLTLFFKETALFWNVFSLVGVLGIISLRKISQRKFPAWIAFSCLASASLFLSLASAESQDVFYKTMLDRFLGTAVIPAAYLMGLGLDSWIQIIQSRLRWLPIAAGTGLFPILLASLSYPIANAAKDRTLDVFREAIALEVPSNSLYISSQSEEYFYGIIQNSQLRFPLMRGQFFQYPWYRLEVLPKLEPRLAGTEIRNIVELRESAESRGINTFVSLDDAVFNQLGKTPELRGVVFLSGLSGPNTSQIYTENTVISAIRLCPLLSRLEELPEDSHGYSHQLRKFFARGFNGAALYLDSLGRKDEAISAYQIFQGLMTSRDSQSWKKGCSDLNSKVKLKD